MDIGDYGDAEKSFKKAIVRILYYDPYTLLAPYHNELGRNPIYTFDNNGIFRDI
jgi:hypothetical protein